jgi:hypothetical protein
MMEQFHVRTSSGTKPLINAPSISCKELNWWVLGVLSWGGSAKFMLELPDHVVHSFECVWVSDIAQGTHHPTADPAHFWPRRPAHMETGWSSLDLEASAMRRGSSVGRECPQIAQEDAVTVMKGRTQIRK